MPRNVVAPVPAAPAAFYGFPTVDQFVQVVNVNSARIHQLQTTGATLVLAGYPDLRADFAVDRPRRLRLRAGTVVAGPELDLGSNDELFWVWVRQQEPPAVYHARHTAVDAGALRDVLPVPPTWLIEAIGLVHVDREEIYEGPYQRWPGRLEIRSRGRSQAAPWDRIIVVDEVRGWILEQHLVGAQRQLLASARLSRHRFDPVLGTSLPREVEISVPAAQLQFTLRVDDYVVNQLVTDPQQLWSMPQIQGAEYLDLADPQVRPRITTLAPAARVGLSMPQPSQDRLPWMRRYQGFSGVR